LYSQWFPGDENAISDSISRDFHLPMPTLTNLLVSSIPDQVPFGLKILSLHTENSSWLICLLRNQPQKEQWSKVPLRSKFARGGDTLNTLPISESTQIPTSINSPKPRNTEYLAHLHTQSEKVDFVMEKLVKSNQDQCEPPWIAGHRPTSWQIEQTQGLTETKSLLSFYNDN
jgi:hypothetical protein